MLKNINEIHVAIAIDKASAFFKFVTLQSLLEHVHPDKFIHFHVLHTDSSPETYNILASAIEDGRSLVHFVNCQDILRRHPEYQAMPADLLQKSLMLFAPTLLKHLPHLIMLEGDLLIRRDISLVLKETGDHPFSAVYCMWETRFDGNAYPCFHKGLKIIQNNLLLETDCERLIALGKTKTSLFDGLVYNHIFKENTHFLPLTWNSQRDALEMMDAPNPAWEKEWEDGKKDPAICNFTGYAKPWLKHYGIPGRFQDEYLQTWEHFKRKVKAKSFPVLFSNILNI